MEIEAKFLVNDLDLLRQKIVQSGAQSISSRAYEHNLRYDTTNMDLTRKNQVLRLREYGVVTLTFKSPKSGYEVREEFEVQVDDFQNTHQILSALGFEVFTRYEKYREVFALEGVLIMLDELPYGRFVEVEGPDLTRVQDTAQMLGLDWTRRIQASYMQIFSTLREKLQLPSNDLIFEEFEGVEIDMEQLGYKYA